MKKCILLSLTLTGCINFTNAQWQQTNGPHTALSSLAINGTKIFAGAEGPGIYRSDVDSDNWVLFNNGLTNNYINALASKDSFVFAASDGFFITSNSGNTWSESHNGINLVIPTFETIAIKGDSIYGGLCDGLYLSSDNGNNWSQVTNGITPHTCISSIIYKGDTIFVGAQSNGGLYVNGVFVSWDNGASWTKSNIGLTDSAVRSLAISGSNLLVGTAHHGVFVSSDNGMNWNADTTVGMGNRAIYALATYNNYVFAGTDKGVFISDNNGVTWAIDTLQYNLITAFTVTPSYIYLTSNGGGIWKRSLSDFILGSSNVYNEPSEIKMFPNPTSDMLNIYSSTIAKATIEVSIIDVFGDLLLEEMLQHGNEFNINVENLPSGVYFIQIKSQNKSIVKKFIKG